MAATITMPRSGRRSFCELSVSSHVVGLAGEDGIVASVGPSWRRSEQIVAQKHGARRREPPAVHFEPAFDGVAFAVLLLGVVLGRLNSGLSGTT